MKKIKPGQKSGRKRENGGGGEEVIIFCQSLPPQQ